MARSVNNSMNEDKVIISILDTVVVSYLSIAPGYITHSRYILDASKMSTYGSREGRLEHVSIAWLAQPVWING